MKSLPTLKRSTALLNPRRVVGSNLLTMLGVSLVVGLLTYVYFLTLPTQYQATARLLIEEAAFFRSASVKGTPLDSAAYIQAALSDEVLGPVSLVPGAPPFNQLRSMAQVLYEISQADQGGLAGRYGSYALIIRHTDLEEGKRLAAAWAKAVEAWDDEYVRDRFKNYRLNLEAQLNQVTQTFKRLRAELPTSDDPKYTQELINYMSLVRGNLFKDIQLTRGLEQSAVGFLNPTRQGVTAMVIGVNPRRNGAIAAGIAFVLLGLGWMWIDRWTAVVALRQRVVQPQSGKTTSVPQG